jgi:hypothetical protein
MSLIFLRILATGIIQLLYTVQQHQLTLRYRLINATLRTLDGMGPKSIASSEHMYKDTKQGKFEAIQRVKLRMTPTLYLSSEDLNRRNYMVRGLEWT